MLHQVQRSRHGRQYSHQPNCNSDVYNPTQCSLLLDHHPFALLRLFLAHLSFEFQQLDAVPLLFRRSLYALRFFGGQTTVLEFHRAHLVAIERAALFGLVAPDLGSASLATAHDLHLLCTGLGIRAIACVTSAGAAMSTRILKTEYGVATILYK